MKRKRRSIDRSLRRKRRERGTLGRSQELKKNKFVKEKDTQEERKEGLIAASEEKGVNEGHLDAAKN